MFFLSGVQCAEFHVADCFLHEDNNADSRFRNTSPFIIGFINQHLIALWSAFSMSIAVSRASIDQSCIVLH